MHPPEAAAGRGPELSIIVPTFNEKANVAELVERLDQALPGMRWEVVFVDDDSPDGTAALVRQLSQADPRVRCIQRIGRRGLSSACIEGFLATSAPYLAVMDADLQHDERVLGPMFDHLKRENLDVVIGSRYVAGGSVGSWDASRSRSSRIATKLAAVVTRQPVADPMSGFFVFRREILAGSVRRLSAVGFKILLDLLASSPQRLRLHEWPYQFRTRVGGESKFDRKAMGEYLQLLLDKSLGRLVPVRFLAFSAVGGTGVVLHMAVLFTLLRATGLRFAPSQATAALAAMTFNYWLNNLTTYRDRRRVGWRWFTGWMGFVLACSVGAVANVGIATFLFDQRSAGALFSAGVGVLVGAVWNYAVTQTYTWSESRVR